jgi:NAD(P)-dependent dehydrogenase (short-subunit alcohol dehydrogenase family)
MAVLDQELGDLHDVPRAIGGAVAKAFAREIARVFLSGRKGQNAQSYRADHPHHPP